MAVAALLFGAGCADHTDISGTYSGDGKGMYQLKGGALTEFTIPRDAILVTTKARHYQYSQLEISVRGCVVRSEGGETSWGVSSHESRSCTFDVPSLGPVKVSLGGGIQRRPPTRSSKPEQLHLSLNGSGENVKVFSYTIEARPAR